MNATQLTFGVEFELYLPYAKVAELGRLSYRHPIEVPGLPAGWVVKTDGSLTQPPAGMTGVEVVSPVLNGAEGLAQVAEVARTLQSWGGKVNYTCGMHVHVGFDKTDANTLGRLVSLVARNELGLFASTGSRLRYEGRPGQTHYAKPIAKDFIYTDRFRDKIAGGLPTNRYFSLNLATIKPTVEFRLFQGTTNAVKAVAYVCLCLGLVERASKAKREMKWTNDTTNARCKGDGSNAIAFLFKELQWWASPTQARYGILNGPGLPSLDKMKKELRRLAKKFDGNTEQETNVD